MNNKGFAISTLIYGLSIMGIMLIAILMSTMSNNRTNTRDMTESIENELISFSKTESSFESSDKSQQYIVGDGQSGWYRIELWGAQGGASSYGAYTSGMIQLEEGELLFFNIGKEGTGQSSDVRLIDGEYGDANSYNSRIMVAAGGGAGNNASGGTLQGYDAGSIAKSGKVDNEGIFDTTATLVGYSNGNNYKDVTIPGPIGQNGGGSGYNSSNNRDIGGISMIAGYAGSINGIHQTITDGEGNSIEKNYYFLDGMMLPGVNKGTGKAKITKIVDYNEDLSEDENKLPVINEKMKNVKMIRDCVGIDASGKVGSTDSETMIAMKDGVALGLTPKSNEHNTTTKKHCWTYELSTATSLDEIAVFHKNSRVDYEDHTIEVSKNGSNWEFLKKSAGTKTKLSETETATGTRISAYQYDSTEDLPKNGNYYIIPVLDENKVIQAPMEGDKINDPLTISFMNGEKNQKWSIELIDNKIQKDSKEKEYKIVELSRHKAMTILDDENKVGNKLVANRNFNNTARNETQIWKIEAVGNGTYTIKNVGTPFKPGAGYIVPKTTGNAEESYELQIGKEDFNGQRFRLMSLEYLKK